MMTGRATVIHVIVAIVWTMSAKGNGTSTTVTSTEWLQPSSQSISDNLVSATATEAFHSGNTEQGTDILSPDAKSASTLKLSTNTPQTTVIELTAPPTATLIATSVVLQTSAQVSKTESTLLATGHVANTTLLSQEADTTIMSVESVLHPLNVTHYQSLKESTWFPASSDADIESTLLQSHSALVESTALLWNNSTALEDQSSTTVSQIIPSQVQPTATILVTESTSLPKPVTDRPASPVTTSKSPASESKIPSQNAAEELPYGAKIAVGLVVAVCVLGVVVAAVVLYRRFNITHRSLKSFLTSGVRYKTYKNATYKDDEITSLHTDNSISAPVFFYRSHKEHLSTEHELRSTGDDPIACILELHTGMLIMPDRR